MNPMQCQGSGAVSQMHFCLPGQTELCRAVTWAGQVKNCSPLLGPSAAHARVAQELWKGCLKMVVDQNLWLLQV